MTNVDIVVLHRDLNKAYAEILVIAAKAGVGPAFVESTKSSRGFLSDMVDRIKTK